MQSDDYFLTQDLALACALLAAGFTANLDENDPFNVVFSFERSESLILAVSRYWDGNLAVDALHYSQKLRNYKARLAESKRRIAT